MRLNKRRLRQRRRERLLLDEMLRADAITAKVAGRLVHFVSHGHWPIWLAYTDGRRGLLVVLPVRETRLFVVCKRDVRKFFEAQGLAADATDV